MTTLHELLPHRFQVLVQQVMSSIGGSLQLNIMQHWRAPAIYRMQVKA